MDFKMKYAIAQDFIPNRTKRRSGNKIDNVKFIVAHDTGNMDSTAEGNVGYYKRSADEISASAHYFVDDNSIIETVPHTEKAWHVLYNVPGDNANPRWGDDANDVALAVELCYFKNDAKRNEESYKRYIWMLAYLCFTYKLDPTKDITTHMILDPERKSDPFNAMSYIGKVAKSDDKKVNAQKTLAKLIADVVAEYNDCTAVPKPVPAKPAAPKVVGKAKVLVSKLNVRNKPVDGKVVDTLDKNEEVTVYAIDTKSGWYIIDAAKTKFISNDKDYTALKK